MLAISIKKLSKSRKRQNMAQNHTKKVENCISKQKSGKTTSRGIILSSTGLKFPCNCLATCALYFYILAIKMLDRT